MSDAPLPPVEPEPPAAPPPAPAPAPAASWSATDTALQVGLAIGGSLGIFVFYQLVMLAWLTAYPDALRSGVLASQVAGLLLPALAAVAVADRLGFLPARRAHAPARPHVAVGVAIWTSCNALLLLALTTSALAVLWPKALKSLQEFMSRMYEPLFRLESPLDVASIILLVTIVPAICEEALFRGFLQRLLAGRMRRTWAVGITAVIFAGVHAEPLGFLSRVALGVGLGVAYERTGSLRLPMFIHALHNLVTSLLFSWEMSDVEIPGRSEALLGLLGAMPALALAAFLWWRALRALPDVAA